MSNGVPKRSSFRKCDLFDPRTLFDLRVQSSNIDKWGIYGKLKTFWVQNKNRFQFWPILLKLWLLEVGHIKTNCFMSYMQGVGFPYSVWDSFTIYIVCRPAKSGASSQRRCKKIFEETESQRKFLSKFHALFARNGKKFLRN